MLGTEGTEVLAHPEGCLVFPELAWSGVDELSQACRQDRIATVPAGWTSSFHLQKVRSPFS